MYGNLIKWRTSPLDETKRQEILKTNTSLAKQALRVLGMAYKYVETIPAEMSSELVEKDLTFAGLVGMIDQKEKAADAVKSREKKRVFVQL